MAGTDVVVAIGGAAIILIALVSVVTIESRSGPFVHDIETVLVSGTATGLFRTQSASGTPGPGGLCLPQPPATACLAATTELSLVLDGLPALDGDALHYVAFLVGNGAPERVGPLAPHQGTYGIDHDAPSDATHRTQLVVTLESRTDPGDPGPFVLFQAPLSSGPPVDLSGPFQVQPGFGSGRLQLNQVGAVTVSTTALATIDVPLPPDGTNYRAWLIGKGGEATALGEATLDLDGGTAVIDKRIERVRITDQERFLVTIEETARPAGPGPQGFPAFAADL